MKRKGVSIMWATGLLLAALLCSPGRAQDNKAQASKPVLAPMNLKVGDMAPDFKLQYFDGKDLKDVSLSQYRDKSNVVVAFYVFAFTGG